MNGLNTTFININPAQDELGGVSNWFKNTFNSKPKSGTYTLKPSTNLKPPTMRTGTSTGRSLGSTIGGSGNYYNPPPPPPFTQIAGRSLSSTLPQYNNENSAVQVLDSANSRGRFETIASLVSQTLAGILPRSTQQIAGQQIQYEQPAYPQGQIYPQDQLNPDGSLRAADRAAQGAGGFANSIVDFVSNNPLMIGGIALGAYLLMREPPIRRR
ncbi:MAG: hypothetical protein ACR2MG_20880 [Pyrinomonadaceae bacterium]